MPLTRELTNRPTDILLVEDNAGDVRLMQELLKECKIQNRLATVRNGDDAVAYLRGEGKYRGAARPDLILLDLNLPRKNGQEVLAEIKADADLRSIPVIILTTSKAEQDIKKAYSLHANCYITKPVDLEDFMRVVQSIESFWLELVVLPESRH